MVRSHNSRWLAYRASVSPFQTGAESHSGANAREGQGGETNHSFHFQSLTPTQTNTDAQ